MTEATGDCMAGYFCESGAINSTSLMDLYTPSGHAYVIRCPPGHYCIAGAEVPEPCPRGTYCLEGSPLPTPCESGTYNMQTGQSSCVPCPPGYMCSPGGVADFAKGTFYATSGLYACADPEGGSRQWANVVELGEVSGSVVKDGDDNIVVTGSTTGSVGGSQNAGGLDVFVSKYDEDGSVIWSLLLGTASDDFAEGLAVDEIGGLYVGVREEAGSSTVVKLDGCGAEAWRTDMGVMSGGRGLGISVWGERAVVVGKTSGGVSFVAMLDAGGSEVWRVDLGLSSGGSPIGVAVDSEGSCFVAGETFMSLDGQVYLGGREGFLVKVNSVGVVQWTRQFGTSSDEWVRGVAVDGAGSVYVGGFTKGSASASSGSSTSFSDAANVTQWGSTQGYGGLDLFVVKYWSDGGKGWSALVGTSMDERGGQVSTDGNGNVYVAGHSDWGSNQTFIAKLSPAGEEHWVRAVGWANSSVSSFEGGVAAGGDG
eukprot:696984-Rhodomonas_salina.1